MHAFVTAETYRDSRPARSVVEQPRALVAIGSARHVRTAWVTTMLTEYLERAGFVTEIADASRHAMPTPPDYDVVVVGMTLTPLGDHALLHWIESFSESLSLVASGLIIVGGPRRRERIVSRVCRAGWMPGVVADLPAFSRHADATERAIANLVDRLAASFGMDLSR